MANNPTLLKMPLAADGEKATIPETTGSTTGEFSQQYGFQAINALPLQAGGIAPKREDMNGVFNLLGGVAYYAQKGWTFKYDSTQAYFAGCVVIDPADGKRYECIADVAAGGTAPNEDTSGTYWKRYSLGDGLPLGAIIPYTSNGNLPTGYLVCDGAAVSRTMYPDLFDLIGTTYGDGDGSTTFNLPDLIARFPEGAATAGAKKEAGLPNIQGNASTSGSCTAFDNTTGALRCSDLGDGHAMGSDPGQAGMQNYPGNDLNLNAAWSNPIYGNSDTVQPASLTVRYIIKAFDGQTEDSALIDVTQYAQDLANKASRNLSNLTAEGKAFTFPSATYLDITADYPQGGTYTAPANGYIYFAGNCNVAGFALLLNKANDMQTVSSSSDSYWRLFLPVQKGQQVDITYSQTGATFTTYEIKFIYAQGEVPA